MKKLIKPRTLILVISNIANEAAATLVDMFPPGAAALITASNFYQSFKGGIGVNGFSESQLEFNGRRVAAGEITGIVSTITNFFPQEFYYIRPADRDYVCAEMNAFFTYFLTELDCKKLNPPTMRSFSGLSLYKTEWIKKAQALHIPVWPLHLKNGRHEPVENICAAGTSKHTIIDGKIVGEQPPQAIQNYLQVLQEAFCMPYLQCYFIESSDNTYYLADILSVPDISSPLNREAIVHFFSKNSLYDSFMGPDSRRTYEHGTLRA